MFGKALGNGYAITAVMEEIMESAKNIYHSTFWTERIGPTAGLACLKEMDKIKSWEIITSNGKIIKENWMKIASKNKINIEIRNGCVSNFYY